MTAINHHPSSTALDKLDPQVGLRNYFVAGGGTRPPHDTRRGAPLHRRPCPVALPRHAGARRRDVVVTETYADRLRADAEQAERIATMVEPALTVFWLRRASEKRRELDAMISTCHDVWQREGVCPQCAQAPSSLCSNG